MRESWRGRLNLNTAKGKFIADRCVNKPVQVQTMERNTKHTHTTHASQYNANTSHVRIV